MFTWKIVKNSTANVEETSSNVVFKACKSVNHHTVQINQPTRCNNFSSLLLDVYLQLNVFRASSRPLSGAQQLQHQPLVLPSERGDSSAEDARNMLSCKQTSSNKLEKLLHLVGWFIWIDLNSSVVTTHVFHTHTNRLTFYIFHEPRYLFNDDTNKASKAQRYVAQSQIAFPCI